MVHGITYFARYILRTAEELDRYDDTGALFVALRTDEVRQVDKHTLVVYNNDDQAVRMEHTTRGKEYQKEAEYLYRAAFKNEATRLREDDGTEHQWLLRDLHVLCSQREQRYQETPDLQARAEEMAGFCGRLGLDPGPWATDPQARRVEVCAFRDQFLAALEPEMHGEEERALIDRVVHYLRARGKTVVYAGLELISYDW